jgi:hypothetical protein
MRHRSKVICAYLQGGLITEAPSGYVGRHRIPAQEASR